MNEKDFTRSCRWEYGRTARDSPHLFYELASEKNSAGWRRVELALDLGQGGDYLLRIALAGAPNTVSPFAIAVY